MDSASASESLCRGLGCRGVGSQTATYLRRPSIGSLAKRTSCRRSIRASTTGRTAPGSSTTSTCASETGSGRCALSADEEPNLPRRERLPSGHFDESDSGQVDDEFCHTHSAYFRGVCQRQERKWDASHTLAEFVEFLRREDAGVLPVMGAIAVTTTPAAATELLGADFCRVRSRLRQLGRCFQTGDPVPRKRRPYRSRARSPHR